MTYPATNLNEAVALVVPDSNAFHEVINGDSTTTVSLPDGGTSPTLQKALVDNFYFTQTTLAWEEGSDETIFNQLRQFTDGKYYYAPLAKTANPIPMGTTPIGDLNWKLLDESITDIASDAYISAIAAQGYANFQGNWSIATGAWDKGNSFRHSGTTWALLVDVTDITTSEPSATNSDWQRIIDDLDAIARANNVPVEKVGYLAVGEDVTGKELLYDSVSGRYYKAFAASGTISSIGEDINGNRTITAGGNSYTIRSNRVVHINSVEDMIGFAGLYVGDTVYTNLYNRKVNCKWLVVDAEDNSYGNYSVSLNNGLFAKLEPEKYITPAMVGAPISPSDSTAACLKAAEFFDKTYLIDGLYGLSGSTPLSFREGQIVRSINGAVTGSSIKAGFVALSAMNPMVDLSSAKYADIKNVIIDGANTAQRGFKATNVFGISMSQCRVFNLTVSCYEFLNDGAGIGSYINSLNKCYAESAPAGFVVSSAESESNLFVFNQCVATDCTNFGFREYGDNTGRDNAYNDCDAERCGIGFLMRSKSFNLVNPYIEFCTRGIVVDATGLTSGIQSGKITSPSILGLTGFPGEVSQDTNGIELIGYCRKIVIENPWIAYHDVGISAESLTTGLVIIEPFIENCNSNYNILTKRYSIRSGNQISRNISNQSTSDITIDDSVDVVFYDIGNQNRTCTINLSNMLIGHKIEIVAIGSTATNTGTLTITGQNGTETFFGQNGENRVGSGATSVAVPIGSFITLYKQSETSVYIVASLTY